MMLFLSQRSTRAVAVVTLRTAAARCAGAARRAAAGAARAFMLIVKAMAAVSHGC